MKLTGRSISRGEGTGKALVVKGPFSFLGGVDTVTGRLTVSSGREGEDVSGKVFIFQQGKGSTVGSYTILDLKKNGHLPAAIINEKAETIVATGAVMAGCPMVDGIDIGLIQDGDDITVNGADGTVELLNVADSNVVTCVLRHQCRILILKRSDKVSTNKLKWAGVSGYIERNETPLETAYKEISEEVQVSDPTLVKMMPPVRFRDGEKVWTIHPFLFDVPSEKVTLDWEHTDHRWVTLDQLDDFDLVIGFKRMLGTLPLS